MVEVLECPEHRGTLVASADDGGLLCGSGCSYPVVAGIPRFIDRSNYANDFGTQWLKFRTTQLDSATGISISADRLERCLGAPLPELEGKVVLEAGCGAGRFTELLVRSGATVHAADLSRAVEANSRTAQEAGGNSQNYQVCQADLTRLPFAIGRYDVVLCLGVLQHTPDPEESIVSLARHVAPGGVLVVDHYSDRYHLPLARRLTRWIALRLTPRLRTPTVLVMSRAIVSVHRLAWRRGKIAGHARQLLVRHSPVVDYYDSYGDRLPLPLLKEWSVLDTHDAVTDVYKHRRSLASLQATVEGLGFTVTVAREAGNGVELKAVKAVTATPLAP